MMRRDQRNTRFPRQLKRDREIPVDEFGPRLHQTGESRDGKGMYPPPRYRRCLQQDNGQSLSSQPAGCYEPRSARSNDQNCR